MLAYIANFNVSFMGWAVSDEHMFQVQFSGAVHFVHDCAVRPGCGQHLFYERNIDGPSVYILSIKHSLMISEIVSISLSRPVNRRPMIAELSVVTGATDSVKWYGVQELGLQSRRKYHKMNWFCFFFFLLSHKQRIYRVNRSEGRRTIWPIPTAVFCLIVYLFVQSTQSSQQQQKCKTFKANVAAEQCNAF